MHIKLSAKAQTLDHEYYRGYGVMGQLYCFDKQNFSRGPRRGDETDGLFCLANETAELFNSAP